jgi:hypothetical protein
VTSGPDHYRKAEERLLMAWEDDRTPESIAHLVAEAQVHATLAQAAATAASLLGNAPIHDLNTFALAWADATRHDPAYSDRGFGTSYSSPGRPAQPPQWIPAGQDPDRPLFDDGPGPLTTLDPDAFLAAEQARYEDQAAAEEAEAIWPPDYRPGFDESEDDGRPAGGEYTHMDTLYTTPAPASPEDQSGEPEPQEDRRDEAAFNNLFAPGLSGPDDGNGPHAFEHRWAQQTPAWHAADAAYDDRPYHPYEA